MLNIVLFGPPGAGKGTQSQKLIDKYNLIHLSTGDLLRSEIKEGTDLGLEAKHLIDQGLLVPDEVVIGMIEHQLSKHATDSGGFIFDGFPRTVQQAEALDNLLEHHNAPVVAMIALEVNEEELTKRVLLRGATSGRSDDRNENLVRKRIHEYNTKTAPVAEYYNQHGKYTSINGIGEVEEIFSHICEKINSKAK